MDNRIAFSVRTIPLMLGGFVANAIAGAFMQIGGLIRFRNQHNWVKTEHSIPAKMVTMGERTLRLSRRIT